MLVSSFGVGEITKQSRSALYGFSSSGIDRTYQIHTNCSEFDATAYALKNRETPIETLRSCSLLNSDTLLAGCSYMTARELDMFAESGAAAVLTPVSNAEAGKESIPMNEFDDRGIPYMIGTDTSRHDVLSSARFSLLQNIQNTGGYERSIRCAAEALFKNAPSFASKRFNVPLGKLEPGAAADIVVFESHPNNAVNTEQMYKHFLFDLCGRDCITSIINGVTVMLDRELMLIDGDASDKDINTVISKLNT